VTSPALDERVAALEQRIAAFEAAAPGDGVPWGLRSVTAVVKVVAALTDISPAQIQGPSRARAIVYPRFIVAWVANRIVGQSYAGIGRALGGRDHASIIWAVRRSDELRASDPEFRAVSDMVAARFTLTAPPAEERRP
jgi:chromosomal replication initiator protein